MNGARMSGLRLLAVFCLVAVGCGEPALSPDDAVAVTRNAGHLVVTIDRQAPTIGSGVWTAVQREVDDFDSVRASHGLDVELVDYGIDCLAITGDENLVPLVVTQVVDGQLRISLREGVDTRNPLVVGVPHAPLLEVQTASGARFRPPAQSEALLTRGQADTGAATGRGVPTSG